VPDVQHPVDGIALWAAPNGPIMIKAIEPSGDPVEMTQHEARALVSALQALIEAIGE